MAWIELHISNENIWFRIFGCGICLSCATKTFSERMGYKKYIPIGLGWRASILLRSHYDKQRGGVG